MNHEGYRDPTSEQAIQNVCRVPKRVKDVYTVMQAVAGLHGFEIIGLRDRNTGKEWRR